MKLTAATHNHTTLCDGKNTPQEMAQAALEAGFTDFGFSGHSYAPFDAETSIEQEEQYIRTLRSLQKEYEGRMRIAVGMESDYFAPVKNRAALDYIIASVHYLYDEKTQQYYQIDASREKLKRCIDEMFGGDGYAAVREYYRLVAAHVQREKPEIVGHFDLIVKNNADGCFFDESSAEYRSAALAALDVCAQENAVIEVNTGGIYRGYRRDPYPAAFLLRAMKERGMRVTVNADAHCTAAISFLFDEMLELLRETGFRTVTVLEDGKFVEKPL